MSYLTTFLKQCPSCGRRLEIKVRHLGKAVQCTHCRSTFTAENPSSPLGSSQENLIDQAIRDAEIYLASVDEINEVGMAWSEQHPQSATE
jgi:transposase-like protein